MFSPASEPYIRMGQPGLFPRGLLSLIPDARTLEQARGDHYERNALNARKGADMTFSTEFPDYPVDSLPARPEGWVDMSWHNDACPCFGTGDVVVFCDFPNEADREYPGLPRFQVNLNPETGKDGTLFASDDWNAVLAFVSARAAAIPATV